MRKSNRVLFKPKVYGFNPWADQMPAIKQIMEETGQESEAPVLRMLIDEALVARRRKAAGIHLPEQPSADQELAESLKTIQVLLLRLIGQGQTTFRVDSLSLELLQETLAEARAGRIGLWEYLAVPALKESGKGAQEIADLFDAQTGEAKDFAYGLAEEIKNELDGTETDTKGATVDNQDRQGRLLYEESDTREGNDPKAA